MTRTRIPHTSVIAGDTVHTWFGARVVERVEPYVGPLTFVVSSAVFTDGTSMALTNTEWVEVTR